MEAASASMSLSLPTPEAPTTAISRPVTMRPWARRPPRPPRGRRPRPARPRRGRCPGSRRRAPWPRGRGQHHAPVHRVEARRGLVEQKRGKGMHEAAGDVDPLLLAPEKVVGDSPHSARGRFSRPAGRRAGPSASPPLDDPERQAAARPPRPSAWATRGTTRRTGSPSTAVLAPQPQAPRAGRGPLHVHAAPRAPAPPSEREVALHDPHQRGPPATRPSLTKRLASARRHPERRPPQHLEHGPPLGVEREGLGHVP
jgi:hypothetical protein